MFAYKMTPTFRHGVQTPWGGDLLRRLFGKNSPDDHTGEALEACTLPGMESRAEDGRTLTEIAGRGLPLLLKLLDAREALAVQVHPDDAYAKAHEEGKAGKAEAWLILHAEPGAKLVYGVKPNTSLHDLTMQNIEEYLRWVPVSAGDALYIPPGMVHAVGSGILLYEIQQASDITYRFWDWGRISLNGKPRELHWDKAIAVTRPELQLSPTRGEKTACEGGSVTHYLQTEYFTLDRYDVQRRMPLPERKGFWFLTALCEGRLQRGEESLSFSNGDTFFVPPGAGTLYAETNGALIVSAESMPTA